MIFPWFPKIPKPLLMGASSQPWWMGARPFPIMGGPSNLRWNLFVTILRNATLQADQRILDDSRSWLRHLFFGSHPTIGHLQGLISRWTTQSTANGAMGLHLKAISFNKPTLKALKANSTFSTLTSAIWTWSQNFRALLRLLIASFPWVPQIAKLVKRLDLPCRYLFATNFNPLESEQGGSAWQNLAMTQVKQRSLWSHGLGKQFASLKSLSNPKQKTAACSPAMGCHETGFYTCPGPTEFTMSKRKDTWDRGMTQSTLGHHLEPCSLEQWTQVMCLKGAKTQSTKHKAQNAKHKTQSTTHSMANKTARSLIWSNFVRKSREAGLMWLLGPIHCLFLEQNGSWWHNPSMSRPYLSQYAMVKGHLRPWDDPKHTWTPPRTMLLGTVNPSHVPEGCQNTKHKTQSTKHKAQPTAWQTKLQEA